MTRKMGMGLSVLAAVALFFALDLQRFLSLESVQGSLGACGGPTPSTGCSWSAGISCATCSWPP
jgi:hypothetical protein